MSKFYMKFERHFSAGQIIFSENNECDGMYIIKSGRVRVFKTAKKPDGTRVELELIQLGPQSIFGEMAIIDNQKRSATVQAISDTKCTVITKDMFKGQLEKLPSWVMNIIQILVVRLRETNEILREKAHMFNDDTGSMVYVGAQDTSQVREIALALEKAISKAQKSLKEIPQ